MQTVTDEQYHLQRILRIGCIICGDAAVPHHVRCLSLGSGTGKKVSHYLAIPLCPVHHTLGGYGMAYHAGPEKWEMRFGTQIELLEQVAYEIGTTLIQLKTMAAA